MARAFDATEISTRPADSARACLPLAGMRVVELCHVAAGPFASMLLAYLGADVVKLEGPQGDQMRNWPPLEGLEDGTSFSHNFASVNRNKKSVTVDLKTPGGRERARARVAEADALIENYRPGTLARFGLDFETVSAGHHGLIYCWISGFGQAGPLSRRGAFDVVIQGMSGLMSVTSEPDGPPVECGVPVGDVLAGLYGAYTIAALYPVTRGTGRSHHVDCAMLDCVLGASALQTSEYWGSGREPRRLGSRHPRNAPYQAFRASDGPFVIAAGNDELWGELCRLVGRPELADDPRFSRQQDRASHQVELEAILGPIFQSRSADGWLLDLGQHGIPSGPSRATARCSRASMSGRRISSRRSTFPASGACRWWRTP